MMRKKEENVNEIVSRIFPDKFLIFRDIVSEQLSSLQPFWSRSNLSIRFFKKLRSLILVHF